MIATSLKQNQALNKYIYVILFYLLEISFVSQKIQKQSRKDWWARSTQLLVTVHTSFHCWEDKNVGQLVLDEVYMDREIVDCSYNIREFSSIEIRILNKILTHCHSDFVKDLHYNNLSLVNNSLDISLKSDFRYKNLYGQNSLKWRFF